MPKSSQNDYCVYHVCANKLFKVLPQQWIITLAWIPMRFYQYTLRWTLTWKSDYKIQRKWVIRILLMLDLCYKFVMRMTIISYRWSDICSRRQSCDDISGNNCSCDDVSSDNCSCHDNFLCPGTIAPAMISPATIALAMICPATIAPSMISPATIAPVMLPPAKKVRAMVIIWVWVQGSVMIRVRVRVGFRVNIGVCHRFVNDRWNKCNTLISK